MKIQLKKLNSRGFAHHLLIPVIAIMVVAGIGAYVIAKPKAMVAPISGGSWHTVKTYYGPWYAYWNSSNGGQNNFPGQSYTISANRTYRLCMDAKANGSYTVNADLTFVYMGATAPATNFGSTSQRICTPAAYLSVNHNTFPNSIIRTTNTSRVLKISQFTFQQYY